MMIQANAHSLRKFQDLNEPKTHECLDEITERWSHYLLGTALSPLSCLLLVTCNLIPRFPDSPIPHYS
jgi:hypothetical protein